MCKHYIVDSSSFAMFILQFGYYRPFLVMNGVYVIQIFFVCVFGRGFRESEQILKEKKSMRGPADVKTARHTACCH